ncbi:MAG: hypothetical protein JSW11_15250 [Candidatus Heimdallarchaeota archaeon]|nr:MAG: hypothetical protein JSW11_15250 [Candidatus Heimdallarchaeota archaeon]
MKLRRLALFWLIFCFLCIIIYFSIQGLQSEDIWVGFSPAQRDLIVSYALSFIEMAFIVGCSLITGHLIWRGIFWFSYTGAPQIKFVLEMFQSWIVVSGFEGSLLFYAEFFSVLVKGNFIPIYFEIYDIINISWINLILVSLFYAFIGFQAYRKKLGLNKFLQRVAFDIGQVTALTVIGVLSLIPYGFSVLISLINPDIIIIYFYYVISVVGIIEVVWSLNQWIEKERERVEQELNATIFFLQTSTIIVPLILIFNLFPFPVYLLITNIGLWIVLLVLSPTVSFSIMIVYHFFNKLAPELFENLEASMDYIKDQFEMVFALRGTVFNYPQPVDILEGGEKTKIISGLWEKVTLKMACGQCFYVFQTQTFKDGSKVKPVPCPFCGSIGTTPVWE